MWNEDKSDYRYTLLVCAPSKRLIGQFLDENGDNHLVHLDWHHTPIHSPFSSYSKFYGVLFFLWCEKGVNAIDVKTLVVFHECALELKWVTLM